MTNTQNIKQKFSNIKTEKEKQIKAKIGHYSQKTSEGIGWIVFAIFGIMIFSMITHLKSPEYHQEQLASGVTEYSAEVEEDALQATMIEPIEEKVVEPNYNKDEIVNTINQFITEINPSLLQDSPCGQALPETWYNAGVEYNNHPYFLVAISFADTTLGKGLTNKCNLGNTGHCDSCAKGHQYNSYNNSIYSMSYTVSNKYLGNGTKSCHFSVGGWEACPEAKELMNSKFYASSKLNWNRNVNWALARLFGTSYQNDFYIKLNQLK